MNCEIALCRECRREFDSHSQSFDVVGVSIQLRENYCEDCRQGWEAKLSSSSLPDRSRQKWESICDAAYLGFEMDKLPEPSRQFAAKVFEWQFGARGVGLAGESRIGKTFVITELFRRWHERGKRVKMVLATDFAYAMGDPDQTARRRMIDDCIDADMLFIDDIAKPKMTDRVETDLFHVLERRKRNLRPVFATLNGGGKTLAAMLSDEGGNAIVNRLRHDVCEFYAI